jgi:hypothetical protein
MSSPGPGRQTTNDHKEYQHFMKSLEQKGPMPPQDNKLLAFQRALSAGTFASNGLVTIATGTNPAYTSPGCLSCGCACCCLGPLYTKITTGVCIPYCDGYKVREWVEPQHFVFLINDQTGRYWTWQKSGSTDHDLSVFFVHHIH